MPGQYASVVDALGLGGQGDALKQQVTEDENEKRKRLAMLAKQQDGQSGIGGSAAGMLGLLGG